MQSEITRLRSATKQITDIFTPFGGICNPAANEYKDLQSEITRLRSASKQITDIFSGLKILILGCVRITTTKCSRPNGSPKGNPEGLGEMMKRVLHEVQLAVP